MKLNKKITGLLAVLALATFALSACGAKQNDSSGDSKKLIIGASPTPHAEILNHVKADLKKEGYELEVKVFDDYVLPNKALEDGSIDANYFQHIPYLEKFAADHKLALTSIAKVHIEPMGVYSRKIKNLADLPEGAAVSIPNDPTNGGRALLLLAKAGVIKLKSGAGITATVRDIAENPRKVAIRELEAAQLPRSFEDVALAVINTNYALDAKLIPAKDALFIEAADSPYVNILAARKGEENRADLKKLAAALNTPEVKKFIAEKYKGAIVAAF
jgi:D-methionine transport system substrate-binding protein